MAEKYKVLIAEDDSFIAATLKETLLDAGFEVCGVAATVLEGLTLADQHHPDMAVIDVRLADNDLGTTLASTLKRDHKIGVLFATGSAELVDDSHGEAMITKPYSFNDLCEALLVLGEYMRTGVVATPFPPAVKVLSI